MFERFTHEAREAVVAGQIIARERNDPNIGTGHLLLGVLADQSTIGSRVLARLGVEAETVAGALADAADVEDGEELDAKALEAIGISLDTVRRRAEQAFGPGALSGRPQRMGGRRHFPFDREARKALELALREALALKHRHIGTEHVVLGLAREVWRPSCSLGPGPQRISGCCARSSWESWPTPPRHPTVVSTATAWELATTFRLGRFPEAETLVRQYASVVEDAGAEELPISAAHALRAGGLRWSHRDPFDRMLVAQALMENMKLVSRDAAISEVAGLAVVW
ncbi:MAG: Clp protease N-terminal domain-containing protein [Egibacteraceae bacterium]